jgi:hypothetical protein
MPPKMLTSYDHGNAKTTVAVFAEAERTVGLHCSLIIITRLRNGPKFSKGPASCLGSAFRVPLAGGPSRVPNSMGVNSFWVSWSGAMKTRLNAEHQIPCLHRPYIIYIPRLTSSSCHGVNIR